MHARVKDMEAVLLHEEPSGFMVVVGGAAWADAAVIRRIETPKSIRLEGGFHLSGIILFCYPI